VQITDVNPSDSIIASNDPEQQEKIIKYNDLVANAVIFQNVVDLTEVLQQLQSEGYLLRREDVACLSPYLTSHIKRFGDYVNDDKQRSVAERNEDVKPIEDPDAIVAIATELLGSPQWSEIAAGLAAQTGRRSSELLSTGHFEKKTEWSVTFTGALKRRGELQTLSFEIPTLASSDKVCQALERLREQLPDAADLTPQQVNARYGQVVAKVCDRAFGDVVPARVGGDLYTHLFRAVYATIATFWYCPPSVDPVEFRAAIQGHYAVLDEENPELRRSLAASRHYADFDIADAVIARHSGKRKGIKLEESGVEPIEMFREAYLKTRSLPPSRKHRSSIRVWREDHDALVEILSHFEGRTQPDKVSNWIAWSLKHLQQIAADEVLANDSGTRDRTDTLIDEIASDSLADKRNQVHITIDAISPEPRDSSEIASDTIGDLTDTQLLTTETLPEPTSISNSDSQALPSRLEAKIESLIDVMTKFVELQLAQNGTSQSFSNQSGTTIPASPAQTQSDRSFQQKVNTTTDSVPAPEQQEKPRRKYKMGADEAIINRAIDAIIAHNNNTPLHDLKWAITINTLKALSASILYSPLIDLISILLRNYDE
jgi:hypothetical protein